ncbi:MAG: MoaD/ThiS family protein [Chloroflexota bacterium]
MKKQPSHSTDSISNDSVSIPSVSITSFSVSVRLNGELTRLAGRARMNVTLNSPATVADLLAEVASDEPSIAHRLHVAVPVIDGHHATQEQEVVQGREVALLMPVAGGSYWVKGMKSTVSSKQQPITSDQ